MKSVPLPKAFVDRVSADPFLGDGLLYALENEAPVSVRFNPFKVKVDLPVKSIIPWCTNGVYLDNRPLFTLDPLFHAGTYYPQEAGSMLLDHVLGSLDLPSDPVILDLCAAPGGKSTLIASFLKGRGLLVSNEIITQRASILRENMVKWGCSNTIVTNNKPSDFDRLPQFFDVVVVDAPCSGEGMFRKDPDSRSEWSESNVILCAERQQTILSDIWETLRPGGYLIYSTCTFNRQENEDNVGWMINTFGAEHIPIEKPDTVITDRDGLGLYCLPGISETEGYYLAVLQKPDEHSRRTTFKSRLSEFKDKKVLLAWVDREDFSFFQREEWIYTLPTSFEKEMLHIQSALRLLKLGVTVGSVARKGLIPSEELALSVDIRSESLVKKDLSREEALSYLKGDTFSVQGVDGWNLITYETEPLGWIKKIGHRFNNHFPKEWRIRMRIDT